MTHPDRDTEALRSALADLRAADEARAPRFGDVVDRRRRVRAQRLSPMKAAFAAALVAAALLGYRVTAGRAGRLTLPKEVAALSAWRPLTDVLLETPGRNLLRSASPLGASIINVNTKGELR